MSADQVDRPAITLTEVVEAAEPGRPRPLGELVARLGGEGRLRAIERAGVPLEAAAVAGLAIGGVSDDSRRLRPGDLFVAIRGARVDGHELVEAALAAGAVAAIVEHPVPGGGVQLIVERSAAALGTAAAWWYGDPSLDLAVVGVTGTDGKTTTAFLAAAALESAGLPTGLVGTVETRVGPVHARTPGHVTTPGALELQRLLRAMVAGGDRAAVIETTSHGLAAERVGGVAYDAAILTNLSHEHLEFHGSFEAYRAAKLSLFERLGGPAPAKGAGRTRLGVVNADDQAAGLFAAATRTAAARLLTYGLAPDADVRAVSVEERAGRLEIGVVAPGWSGQVALRLAGRFNVHNALAALALGVGWELDPEAVRAGVEGLPGVPGRMERIERGQLFAVIVDFAHSPAALQVVLDELGPVATAGGGGLIAVFGSAGERDTAKRAMMGRIAGERSRLVVVTDEDPRNEDRLAILDQIAAGAESAGRRRGTDLLVVPDRATAIAEALGRARPGDVVVLAGKGHEPTMEGPTGALPWDERAVAERALAALGFGDGD
jgi:UDP-N-acetylmuramoyl-L-alanyl-D-glutamate--2,6-diaminopimelate ligase